MNTLSKFLTLFVAISFIALGAEKASAQDVPLNVAVVNIEKILATADVYKSIREQLNNKRTEYRNEVQKDDAALRTANEELAQKQALLAPEAFKEERRKFEQKLHGVQKKIQQRNIQLQKAEAAANDKVKVALRSIILKIADEKGYTLVLKRSQTVVVADAMEITDAVISALNKNLPKVAVFK